MIDSPRLLYQLRLGGAGDATPLLGIAASGWLSSPFFSQFSQSTPLSIPIITTGAYSSASWIPIVTMGTYSVSWPSVIMVSAYVLAAVSAAALTRRIKKTIGFKLFNSSISINSDPPPVKLGFKNRVELGWSGMLLGYCSDTGTPIIVEWEKWMRHCFIIGQSGVGKTVLGEWLMFQQITQGGGLLFIDGKLDEDNLNKLFQVCSWAGRREDLLVINPGKPKESNTYNPILFGDPDEIAARVLSLIPSSEGNAGTDFYRQAANQGITTLVAAIQKAGKSYNFMDLAILLQNQKALNHLEVLVPKGTSEGKQLSLFLEQYRIYNKEGVGTIDLKRLKETFGGVGGRMHQFGSGNFGEITGSYTPEVNLFEAIKCNKIIYVALPTMGKAEAASNFGKMVVGDLRTAISWVQALKKEERPWPPFLGFFDEAGSYVTDSWSRIFEQSRSAHMAMLPAVQTIANLDAVSEELREMVLGNTWTKAYFKIGTDESAQLATELIGTEISSALSLAASGGAGESASAGTGNTTGVAHNVSSGVTEREEEVQRVSADALKGLGIGEAIVTYGGDLVYHLKIPQIKFDADFIKSLGKFQLHQTEKKDANGLRISKSSNGLNLIKNIDRWLHNNDE